MTRTALLLLLGIVVSEALVCAGSLDPAFNQVPFDQWFRDSEQNHIRFSAKLSHPVLSNHQRLVTRVEVQLDGKDLSQRRGKGEMVIFVQFTDGAGEKYQDHGSIRLDKLDEKVRSELVSYTQSAFVLPGLYGFSVAVFDTATGEHSVKQESFRVSPYKNDPLPESWRNLPSIEFLPSTDPPEGWFMPEVKGRLSLPAEPKHPVQVDVILNLSNSQRSRDRNLAALLPSLKVLSQIDVRNSSLNIAFLDLSRRRVAFHKQAVKSLEWTEIKPSLVEAESGTIDVKALEDGHHSAAFFVSEVARLLTAEGTSQPRVPRAVIILSAPMEFESGEDLHAIHVTEVPDSKLFYVRYHPPAPPTRLFGPVPGGRRGGVGGGRQRRPMPVILVDQLEPTLKPVSPNLFDVESPDEFRKALAIILEDISRM